MPNHHQDDDHDRGLAFDLSTLMGRRQLFGLIGVAGAGALVAGCNPSFLGGDSQANVVAAGEDGKSCIQLPSETSGPFPADGTNRKGGTLINVLTESGAVRQDIRSSFGTLKQVAGGLQTDLVITLVDVANGCKPLAGYAIYIWHCDADGKYSIYDLEQANYLRGVGFSDQSGQVRFTTIFPGCYAGRWPHIHFEVFENAQKAVSGDASMLISQFALPEAACKSLYSSNSAYASSQANLKRSPLASDMVFADNTPEQIAAQTLTVQGDPSAGFTGSVTIGLAGA